MPQASEKDRAWARKKFGGITDSTIVDWLQSQGYVLNEAWQWRLPPGTNQKNMPKDEVRAIVFLMDEWDYGGLEIKLT